MPADLNCESCAYNGPQCSGDCVSGHMPYQVMVSGSALYATDDKLVADAVVNNYRTIGWKNVHIKERGKIQ